MIFIWLLKMVWQVHKLYWRRSCTESWVIICGMRCILFYGLDLFASFQHMHILIYISMSLPHSFPLLLYPLGPVPQVREVTGVSGERRANGEMASWIRKVSSTVSIWSNSSTKHRAKCMVFFNIHSKWPPNCNCNESSGMNWDLPTCNMFFKVGHTWFIMN